MISLQMRFKKVFSLDKYPKQSFLNGILVLTADRDLVYEADNGGSCGIDDDVYAFVTDEKNSIWYVKCSDLLSGSKAVYRFNFDNIQERNKGVIDIHGGFIYKKDDAVYRENRIGEKRIVGDVNTFKDLLAVENDIKYLTVERIDNTVEVYIDKKSYTKEEMYKDLLELHSMVDCLCAQAKCGSSYNFMSAEIIFKIFQICKRRKSEDGSSLLGQLREKIKTIQSIKEM
ncbi:MAG: hypothetical protein IKK24_04855 [Clostridia bacterium]|nr:hypothetical protein [Clostridia bacterium]